MVAPTRWDTALALTTTRIGRPLWHYQAVASTMPLAHEMAQAGATDGTSLFAEEQTAGRGRHGRTWTAPRGSAILCSTICRPPLPPAQLFLLIAAFSVGIGNGIAEATGITPAIKWPNDLLLDGRKLAGILSETRLNRDGLAHAAVGFGINVNLSAADLPTPAAGSLPPTSLAIALGQQLDREQLLCTILQAIDQTYAQLWAGNHDAIREAWAARLVGYGERVTITTNANTHQGIMRGIDTDGALLLEIAGKTERFLSGDVLIGPRFPQR